MDAGAFAAMANTFANMATSYLPEFPGHGQTPPPPAPWGTRDYADATAAWLQTLQPATKRIWVGHSFGCRVALQLAAHYPNAFQGMVLIGAAGLKRKRSLANRINNALRVYTFKTLKLFVPEGPKRDALRGRFGSSDYKRAGIMRPTFVKVVSEDLTAEAAMVTCPTLIICGSRDTETPPEISRRLESLIKGSQLQILDGFDHYSILGAARHQVSSLIKNFMDRL